MKTMWSVWNNKQKITFLIGTFLLTSGIILGIFDEYPLSVIFLIGGLITNGFIVELLKNGEKK